MGNPNRRVGKQATPAVTNNNTTEEANLSQYGIEPFPAVTVAKKSAEKTAKANETFSRRKNFWERDVVISETGVRHNAVQVTKIYPLGRHPYEHVDSQLIEKNFMKSWWSWDDAGKAAFFTDTQNSVEIQIWMGEGDDVVNTLLTPVLKDLPQDLVENVKNLTITLKFPTFGDEKIPASAQGFDESEPFLSSGDDLPETLATYSVEKNYKVITELVPLINRFTSLIRAEVVLTPSNVWTEPMTKFHLNYLQPFYDLTFTKWAPRFRSSRKAKPIPIHGWPMRYLGSQRNKVIAWREKQEKAFHEQTFVTPSADPRIH